MPKKRTAMGRFKHEGASAEIANDGRGTGTWLPLVQGRDGLTPDRGFATQADVLVNARGAADAVGATPMDRPEDIQTNPHIIEITERGDAASTRFTWEIFMLAGNPDDPSTFFAGFPKDQVSPIASPDNVAFDGDGHMWLATDGQPDAIGFSDGFYAVPVEGDDRGHVRMFASVPRGAEATGPAFSPDGSTFFASIQHPGEGGSIAQPHSRQGLVHRSSTHTSAGGSILDG